LLWFLVFLQVFFFVSVSEGGFVWRYEYDPAEWVYSPWENYTRSDCPGHGGLAGEKTGDGYSGQFKVFRYCYFGGDTVKSYLYRNAITTPEEIGPLVGTCETVKEYGVIPCLGGYAKAVNYKVFYYSPGCQLRYRLYERWVECEGCDLYGDDYLIYETVQPCEAGIQILPSVRDAECLDTNSDRLVDFPSRLVSGEVIYLSTCDPDMPVIYPCMEEINAWRAEYNNLIPAFVYSGGCIDISYGIDQEGRVNLMIGDVLSDKCCMEYSLADKLLGMYAYVDDSPISWVLDDAAVGGGVNNGTADGTDGGVSDGVDDGGSGGIDNGTSGIANGATDGVVNGVSDGDTFGDVGSWPAPDVVSPDFNTELEVPDKAHWVEDLKGFVVDNPLVGVIKGSAVEAVPGRCEFSGEVFDRPIRINFCPLASWFQLFGAFFVVVCGIAAFFIAWGS